MNIFPPLRIHLGTRWTEHPSRADVFEQTLNEQMLAINEQTQKAEV